MSSAGEGAAGHESVLSEWAPGVGTSPFGVECSDGSSTCLLKAEEAVYCNWVRQQGSLSAQRNYECLEGVAGSSAGSSLAAGPSTLQGAVKPSTPATTAAAPDLYGPTAFSRSPACLSGCGQ